MGCIGRICELSVSEYKFEDISLSFYTTLLALKMLGFDRKRNVLSTAILSAAVFPEGYSDLQAMNSPTSE
jgi:hypothetical protein